MMRSLVVAVTITAALILGSAEHLAATSQPTPAGGSFSYPVDIAGGTPGVNLEMFVNNGKVADLTIGAAGDVSWVLDLSNVGKTRVTLYVDVCKDGKIVKVAFVTGNGQPPPEDEGCDRRIAAVGWTSDCGVTRITIDIRTWGANVLGCAPFYLRPPFIGLAGGAVVLPFIVGRGDGSTTAIGNQPPPQTSGTATPTANTNQPPPQQPQQPPAQPVNVTVRIVGFVGNHPPGATTSIICAVVVTDPPQPGATVTITFAGPGLLPPQSITVTLNAQGQAQIRGNIGTFGTYTANAVITVNGQQFTGTATVIVTSVSTECPVVGQ